MQVVKNELALPNPSLTQGSRAEAVPAPAENRITSAANHIRALFHARFEAWITTPEDSTPNIGLSHLPAAALSPAALSMVARREEAAQQVRSSRGQR